MSGGQIIAQVLQSHGVKFLFTLCGGHISPILKGAKDLGIRVIDGGRGNGGAGRHEHDNGHQERPARTVTAGVAGWCCSNRAERPRRAAGY